MSVAALKPMIRDIRADGFISLDEAKMLTNMSAGNNVIGTQLDNDEFELVRNVAADMRPTNDTTPVEKKVDVLNGKNTERLVHKGMKYAGITGASLAGASLKRDSGDVIRRTCSGERAANCSSI